MKGTRRTIAWSIGLAVVLGAPCRAQIPLANKHRIDSLTALLATCTSDTARLALCAEIADGYGSYKVDSTIAVLERGIALAERTDHVKWLAQFNSLITEPLYSRGELWRSMRHGYEAERLYLASGDSLPLADLYNSMGNNLKRQGAWTQAMRYYRINQWLAPRFGQKDVLAYSHMNLGECFLVLGSLDSALYHNEKAAALMDSIHLAYHGKVYANIARVYDLRGDRGMELHFARKALAIGYLERGERRELPDNYVVLGIAHKHSGRLDPAIHFARKGYDLARRIPVILTQRSAAALLADCFEQQGRIDSAFRYQKILSAVKDSIDANAHLIDAQTLTARVEATSDSVSNAAHIREMDVLRENEVQKERTRRNILLVAGLVAVVFGAISYRQRRSTQKALRRSDELLLNILPEEVAAELKAKGSAEAVHLDQVTVLFTDFKGFTAMSEVVTPQQLVRDLNECFSAFDNITGKYGIEKIKTIGDAYMAAGGLPTPNTTHAADVIKAALEMRDFIAEGKVHKIAAGLPFFEVRIGVHTGPVVAGIVGVKKFQYDIWGDTVNTASRMESSGEVGQVNISEATYALVHEHAGRLFTFTPRGKVEAKGKGEIEMYFVAHA